MRSQKHSPKFDAPTRDFLQARRRQERASVYIRPFPKVLSIVHHGDGSPATLMTKSHVLDKADLSSSAITAKGMGVWVSNSVGTIAYTDEGIECTGFSTLASQQDPDPAASRFSVW